jgi:hypothetical protein
MFGFDFRDNEHTLFPVVFVMLNFRPNNPKKAHLITMNSELKDGWLVTEMPWRWIELRKEISMDEFMAAPDQITATAEWMTLTIVELKDIINKRNDLFTTKSNGLKAG